MTSGPNGKSRYEVAGALHLLKYDCPATRPPPQLGLLDLSVDLSVPEVYSGTDFTLYLHIKNPVARPIWVQSVEPSLPTQLAWRESEITKQRRRQFESESEALMTDLRNRSMEISRVRDQLAGLADTNSQGYRQLAARLANLESRSSIEMEALHQKRGGATLTLGTRPRCTSSVSVLRR